jgi:hypothetical protein
LFWVITILSLQKSAALKFHSRYLLISRSQGKLKSYLNTSGFSVRRDGMERTPLPLKDQTASGTGHLANELAARKGKAELSDRVAVLIRRPDSAPTKPRSDGREDRFHQVHVIGNA